MAELNHIGFELQRTVSLRMYLYCFCIGAPRYIYRIVREREREKIHNPNAGKQKLTLYFNLDPFCLKSTESKKKKKHFGQTS